MTWQEPYMLHFVTDNNIAIDAAEKVTEDVTTLNAPLIDPGSVPLAETQHS